MKNLSFVFCLLMMLTLFSSCDMTNREEGLPDSDNFVMLQSSSNIRSGGNPDTYYYLGRGFDLLSFPASDIQGVLPTSILDQKRIENNEPWDPFGNNPGYLRSLAPKPITLSFPENSGWNPVCWLEDVSSKEETSDVSVHVGADFMDYTLSIKHNQNAIENESLNTYRSHRYKIESKVEYDTDNVSDYVPYLNARFVDDLKRLTAAQVVSKYGTHIVSSYILGPFYDLKVSTLSPLFSKKETLALASNLIRQEDSDNLPVDLSPELTEKLSKYSHQTSIILTMGGSSYQPHNSLLRFRGISSPAEVIPFSESEWYKEIEYGNNTFMSLNTDSHRFISIASLITDIPLKVKYLSGIIDRKKGKEYSGLIPATRYMLCSPTTFEPLQFDDKYVYISLPRFEDSSLRTLHLGDTMQDSISDALGISGLGENWNFSLNEDGLWVISQELQDGTTVYLCNDYRVRSKDSIKDKSALYWLLNPILTKEGKTAYGTYHLFVKKI